LVNLQLHSQMQITDEAFEGLPIQELYINQNTLISDQGILQLKHLQKLTTSRTPQIRGEGYQALPHLTTLYMNGATLSNFSDFKHIRALTLVHCRLPNDDYESWSSLYTLQIYHTSLDYPSALFKVSLAPHLTQITLEHCPSLASHEAHLRKYFGSKLICHRL